MWGEDKLSSREGMDPCAPRVWCAGWAQAYSRVVDSTSEAAGSMHGDDSALHTWQRGVSGVSAELGLTEMEHVAQVGALMLSARDLVGGGGG